jgi:hypothetical protein
MMALAFVYFFMWGACYAVGNGALKSNALNDKHGWINRPLSLVVSSVWPLLFLFWIAAALVRRKTRSEGMEGGG